MKKRFLASLLALIMLLGILPTSAFAAEDGTYSNKEQAAAATGVQADKTVTENADGTYTITLSVKGTSTTETTENQLPADVVLVVDTSGSMAWCGGELTSATAGYRCTVCSTWWSLFHTESCCTNETDRRLKAAKAAAKSFVDGLLTDGSQIKVGLADFSGESHQNVTTQLTDSKATLTDNIDKLSSDHNDGTNYTAGLKTAQSILRSGNNTQKFVVFISDGKPESSYQQNVNGTAVAEELKKSGVTIMTVGIDVSGDMSRYLTAISSTDKNGKPYYSEAGTDTLGTILTTLKETITSTINAGSDAVMTDTINTASFELVENSAGEGLEVGQDGKLTWNIGDIGAEEQTVSFQVRLKEGNTESGLLQTNSGVELTFNSTKAGKAVKFTQEAIGQPATPVYKVTYTVDGKSESHCNLRAGGDTPAYASETARTGYEFAWSPAVAEKIGGNNYDITYTGTWTPKKDVSYTVKYVCGAEEIAAAKTVIEQTFGTTVTETAILIDGYTVTGEASQTVTLDAYGKVITFNYAQNPDPTYTITYTYNETDIPATTTVSNMPNTETGVKAGTHYVSDKTPTRDDDYVFAGWITNDVDQEGKSYEPGDSFGMPNQNVTFTATWEKKPDPVKEIRVSFYDDESYTKIGETQVITAAGGTITVPTEYDGKAIVAWHKNNTSGAINTAWTFSNLEKLVRYWDETTDADKSIGYLYFYAEYEPEPEYVTVTFHQSTETFEHNYGTGSAEMPVLQLHDADYKLVEKLEKRVEKGAAVQALTSDECGIAYDAQELYELVGWSTKQDADPDTATDLYVFSAKVTEDIDLYPVLKAKTSVETEKTIKVYFEANGGSWADNDIAATYRKEFTLYSTDRDNALYQVPAVKAPEGKTFKGWECTTGNSTFVIKEDGQFGYVSLADFVTFPEGEDAVSVTYQAVYEDVIPTEPQELVATDLPTSYIVKCVNKDSGHPTKEYGLLGGGFRIGEVKQDENGVYTCEITILGYVYATQYNLDTDTTHPATANDVKFDMTWDSENEKWVAPAATAIDPIEVDCTEVAEPERVIEVNFVIFDGSWTDGVPAENSRRFVLRSTTAAAELIAPEVVAPSGKVFSHWESRTVSKAEQEFTFTYNDYATLTDYAVTVVNGVDEVTWTAVYEDEAPAPEKVLSVKFVANGGGWTDSVPATNARYFTLSSTTATAELIAPEVAAPSGKVFSHWESRTVSKAKQEFTFTYNDYATLTDYAVTVVNGVDEVTWTAVYEDEAPAPEKVLSVKFVANGGGWTDSVPATNARYFTLSSTTATAELIAPEVAAPSGKVFSHWESRTVNKAEQEFTFTYNDYATLTDYDVTVVNGVDEVTWTAVYKKESGGTGGTGGTGTTSKKYTLEYETNGGDKIKSESEKSKWTKEYEDLPIPTKRGYKFDGWYYNEKLTKKVDDDVEVNETKVTIYAKWVKGVADPRDTGVANWLNTEDHIAFLHGYQDSTFKPNRNMSRAEVAQMFYNLLLNKEVPTDVQYSDVKDGDWYAPAVRTLSALGIVGGYKDGTYKPYKAVTRAEFTVIAMRFAELDNSGENIFTDVNEGDWYYDAIVGSIKYGWISGYDDGTFRPNATITRAGVATIVDHMLGRSADEDFVDDHADDVVHFTDLDDSYWAYYNIMEATNPHTYRQDGGMEDWKKLQ